MIKTEIFMKYILKKNQEMEFHHKKNKIKWTISPISSILKPKRSNCLIMCHSIPHFITIHFSKKTGQISKHTRINLFGEFRSVVKSHKKLYNFFNMITLHEK